MSARFNNRLALVLAACLSSAPMLAQEQLQIPRERVFSFDMLIDPVSQVVPGNTGGAGVAWTATVRSRFLQGGGLDGIRIHVRLDSPLAVGQRLRVLDASGTEVDDISGSSTTVVSEFWSRDTPDGEAVVELSRAAGGAAPGAAISYAYQVTPTEKQSISGKYQLIWAVDGPARFRKLGKSVARLRFMVDGQGQATCTAFLVGARLALTNQHCISNDRERASALVDFNYDNDDSRLTGIRVAAMAASSASLDYALLKLAADPPAGSGRLYFVPVGWQWIAPPAPHNLVVVQHPSGQPKRMSIADCHLAGLDRVGVSAGDRSDFGHFCDTLGGSSGSPILDWNSGLVVGLHHFGFPAGTNDPVNQGVVHARILADILQQDKAAHAEMVQPRPTP